MEPIAWAYYWLKSLHTSINIRLVLILEVVSKIGAEQALINLSPKWKVFLKFVEYSQGAGRLKIGCDVISRHNSNPIFWLNKKKSWSQLWLTRHKLRKNLVLFLHFGMPAARCRAGCLKTLTDLRLVNIWQISKKLFILVSGCSVLQFVGVCPWSPEFGTL